MHLAWTAFHTCDHGGIDDGAMVVSVGTYHKHKSQKNETQTTIPNKLSQFAQVANETRDLSRVNEIHSRLNEPSAICIIISKISHILLIQSRPKGKKKNIYKRATFLPNFTSNFISHISFFQIFTSGKKKLM